MARFALSLFCFYLGWMDGYGVQHYFSYIVAVSFIGGVPNLPQVTDKPYHILAKSTMPKIKILVERWTDFLSRKANTLLHRTLVSMTNVTR
jgi:hypothetical protein